jgi:hypothetical protein
MEGAMVPIRKMLRLLSCALLGLIAALPAAEAVQYQIVYVPVTVTINGKAVVIRRPVVRPLRTTVATPPPSILFTDVVSGPLSGGPDNLGVPITIVGKGFGATRGSSTVTIGGVEVAAYPVWGSRNAMNPTLDMIVVQPGPNTVAGRIVVTVDGRASTTDVSFNPSNGRIRYVALNGSDSNPCTLAAPCATLLHTVEPTVTQPGDTVLVRGGDYRESEIWIRREYNHGGTAAQRKTLKNYPGESVTFSNGARSISVDADYITIAGFRFLDGKSVGVPDHGDAERRRGNWFINNSATGAVGWSFIDSHGDDHILAGNVCEATTSAVGTQGHCYYVSYGNNIKLLYNIGSGAPGYGIHIFDQRRSSSDFRRVISNVLVEGNILKNSKQRSGLIIAMGDEDNLGNRAENIIVRNNIFTGNNHQGVTLGGYLTDIQILNNTFYQNGRQALAIGETGDRNGISIRNNLFFHSPNSNCKIDCSWYQDAHVQFTPAAVQGLTLNNNGYFPGEPIILNGVGSNMVDIGRNGDAAAITGAVQFLDPPSFDFRVQAGGAVIDRGAPIGALVPIDAWGVMRPQGAAMDIGAFEYY